MRTLYSIIYYLAIPFILLRLLVRSRKSPAYKRRINERFAFFPSPTKSIDIWIHAVSLGEVIGITPLVKAIQKKYPKCSIAMTAMTTTGSDRIIKTFGNTVFHLYAPYDTPYTVKRFLAKTKPKCLIIMETELWPNILYYADQQKIPVMLANARLSAKSAKSYSLIRYFMRSVLACISTLAVQTQAEAERFIDLGMLPERIKVTGSLKFDIKVPENLKAQATELRQILGDERPIWIAASTHEGEEEEVLNAFSEVKKTVPECLLVLVPRHPERFKKVTNLCKQQKYKVALRTQINSYNQETEILIGDTMGELMLFYSVADVAFVGGSLVPLGGHNLLEPAAVDTATITGTHIHNFKEITAMLLANNGLKQIHSSSELSNVVIDLLQDPEKRAEISKHATQIIEENRGSLKRHLEMLDALLAGANVARE